MTNNAQKKGKSTSKSKAGLRFAVIGWSDDFLPIVRGYLLGGLASDADLFLEDKYGIRIQDVHRQVNAGAYKDLQVFERLIRAKCLERRFTIQANNVEEAWLALKGLRMPRVKCSTPLRGRPYMDGDLIALIHGNEKMSVYALRGVIPVLIGDFALKASS